MPTPTNYFTLPTSQGEAVGYRDSNGDAWLLSTPWWDDRFYGSETAARRRLAARISRCEAAERRDAKAAR